MPNNSLLYAVKDWTQLYESHDSRKVKALQWVKIPNKHDGNGYRRVMAHPDGLAIFGAWILLLELASKMPQRGVLADEDGPLSPEDMAFMTGAPARLFEVALSFLAQKKVGWLTVENGEQLQQPQQDSLFQEEQHLPESPVLPPTISRNLPPSPADLPESPVFEQKNGTNPVIEKRRIEKSREEKSSSSIHGLESAAAPAPPAAAPLPHRAALIPITTSPPPKPPPKPPAPPIPDDEPDRSALAAQAVDTMLRAHWVPSNRSTALAAMERVLADAVRPESVAAAMIETHQQHSSYRRQHPECKRRPQLAYWISDGDYLHGPPAAAEETHDPDDKVAQAMKLFADRTRRVG